MGYPQLPFGMASLPLFGANPLMGANLLAAASAANAQNMQASLGKLHLLKVQNKLQRVFKASLFVASSTMMAQPTAAAVSSVASVATTSSSAKQPRGRGRGCAREK